MCERERRGRENVSEREEREREETICPRGIARGCVRERKGRKRAKVCVRERRRGKIV